jgi:hypothetical protein
MMFFGPKHVTVIILSIYTPHPFFHYINLIQESQESIIYRSRKYHNNQEQSQDPEVNPELTQSFPNIQLQPIIKEVIAWRYVIFYLIIYSIPILHVNNRLARTEQSLEAAKFITTLVHDLTIRK